MNNWRLYFEYKEVTLMVRCTLCGMAYWPEHIIYVTIGDKKCAVCTVCYNRYFRPIGR